MKHYTSWTLIIFLKTTLFSDDRQTSDFFWLRPFGWSKIQTWNQRWRTGPLEQSPPWTLHTLSQLLKEAGKNSGLLHACYIVCALTILAFSPLILLVCLFPVLPSKYVLKWFISPFFLFWTLHSSFLFSSVSHCVLVTLVLGGSL